MPEPETTTFLPFCQSFMTELHRHLGEHTDVPGSGEALTDRSTRAATPGALSTSHAAHLDLFPDN
ncbi:MAG TPA: hypothetical protein VFK05_24695 [Polyangiaceae bacterium]|nr:hypothetical protein [Polyangiaceae bacterium]